MTEIGADARSAPISYPLLFVFTVRSTPMNSPSLHHHCAEYDSDAQATRRSEAL